MWLIYVVVGFSVFVVIFALAAAMAAGDADKRVEKIMRHQIERNKAAERD